MVLDERLGYDPEEWEECEETEKFMVFAPFTRLLLTAAAIAFVYYFFRLLDQNKNKSKDEKEEEAEPQQRVEKVIEAARELQLPTPKTPVDAEELLREADHYLRQTSQNGSAAVQRGADAIRNNFPTHELPTPTHATQERFDKMLSSVDNHLQQTSDPRFSAANQEKELYYQNVQQKPTVPEHHIPDHFQQQPYQQLPADFDVYDIPGVQKHQQQQQQVQPPVPPPRKSVQQPQSDRRSQQISEKDERAFLEWEAEKARLEADRLSKLLDTEVGGESSTDLSNSAKAYEKFSPGSHISYESRSEEKAAQIGPTTPVAKRNELTGKILNHIEQTAGQQNNPGTSNLRDSQLTDYDISDFNPVEASNDGSAWQETHFNAPQAIQEQHRRTTADSDDYVKITEPIYDYPPRNEKAISPHEAAQLQELAQEYDFGLDIPGVASPPVQQPQPAQKELEVQHNVTFVDPFGRPIQPFEAVPPPQQVRTQQASPPRPADQNVRNLPINIQRTFAAPNQQQNAQQTVQIQGKDDPKNLADAEMFVQDALEYLGNQDRMGHSGGFVMEEEMLSSHGGTAQKKNKQHSGGAEATSRQIKTTDVFERVEHDEHDDMTYAPEIQSVEIPPDQLSENSDNLLDYFDHVAAEGVQAHPFTNFPQGTLKKNEPTAEPSGSSLKPVGRAPQILPAFGNRAASSSSLASGRSGRSGRSPSGFSSDAYPHHLRKQSSVLSVLGVTSMQEMLLTITSLDSLSDAMRRAGLETTNMIFGIDYTASNKYQGEDSFGGRSLHTIHPNVKNPYQQVITILGRTLAPFASTGRIGVYGFGDAKTGDWATFPLKPDGDCYSLDEVLKVYNEVTPTVALSGPTNFAPLIYQAMEICQKSRDYHILVIIADGQVTNEKATRRAIVQACQHPLSIIVVGVGDGPWDMMKVFDESLPKRPWDNFHFVEFHEIMKRTKSMEEGDVKLAVQSLLEIPDQYRCVCELGLLTRSIPPRGSEIRRQLMHNPL